MMRQIFACVVAYALILLPASVAPSSARAATVIVVGATSAACPNPQFSTIQAAVNAASPGSTIRICAGRYPEQVSIRKSLSLRGESGVVVIPSNVTANATGSASGQPIAAILLVEDATDVDIRDLTVDGTNNGITECAPVLIGILYQNASGEVSHVAVRNLTLSASLNGCQSGLGILVQSGSGETSTVTISGSSIHDYQKNGITANEVGTQVTIENNVVTGIGPTSGAAQNGIQVAYGAAGSITGNAVANHVWSPCVSLASCSTTADDILVYESDSVVVNQNVAGTSQTGIAITANSAQVDGNRVFQTLVFDGIQLVGNSNDAKEDSITNSGRAGIFIQGNNNVVRQNQINEANYGVLKASGSMGNIITNNDFFNAPISVQDPQTQGSKASPYR